MVAKYSGGHLKLHTIYYNARSTGVDVRLAAALASGKLDVGDVASRAWESQGVGAFTYAQLLRMVFVTSPPPRRRFASALNGAGRRLPSSEPALAIAPAG